MVHGGWVRRPVVALAMLSLVAAALAVTATEPAGAVPAMDEPTFRAAWIGPATATIDLTADITLTCALGGSAVRPVGAVALTLDGHGHTITQTCPSNQALFVDATSATSFANVTVTGGQATGGETGGGIKSHGPLTLTNTVVTGNTSTLTGGGVSALAALSQLTMVNSTVSNNTAAGGGGGIETAGTATLTNSTVSGNHSGAGGAGISAVGAVTLAGSTVSGNTAIAGGGGIASPSLSATNSTITGNTAGVAGGGGITTGTATLTYATVVQNSAPTGANVIATSLTSFASVLALPGGGGANCVVTGPTSQGFNFSDDASCGLALGTDRQSGNPALGPLASNGGPTQTRLPTPGSPLIDAIPLASCQAGGAAGITTDQRGVTRPQGPGCDIGAVEVAVVVPVVVTPRFTG
jgi:predicted outer membrane repeat protein